MTPVGRDRTVTFGAVGDMAFVGAVAAQMGAAGVDWVFERMRPHLERADLLFGTMETVVVPEDYPRAEIDPQGLVSPLAGPAIGHGLARAGFDFVNLAANHILDAGTVGLSHTRRVLSDAGLVTGGVGATQAEARALAVVERGGIRFGFLCYCEDSNYSLGTRGPCHAYYTRESVLEDVARHRRAVDVLVVSVHADLEFMPTPSVPRLQIFRDVARAGADIVLGHHPHVPQGCEIVDGCLIVYSLGNFVFPARSSAYMRRHGADTARSFLLLAEVGRGGVRAFERVPFEIGHGPEERPAPLEGPQATRMLEHLGKLDGHLEDDAFLRDAWRAAATARLATYVEQLVRRRVRQPSRWRRVVARLLAPPVASRTHDIERIIADLVPRLCLTAENRSWMEEILRMGRERWEERNRERPDPLHRPHWRLAGE
jgi:poly-gamma-glutamate synthesis protein (capsule biosynthesis protein)